MALTNFPNGVSSFGIPTMGGGGIPITPGTYYFVDYGNGSDLNDGLSMDTPMKTVAAAYALMTTNKYDVLVCLGSSAHVISGILEVSKNRCIFVGLDGANRRYGQRTRWTMGVTTDTDDIAIVSNTGVGNVFLNIKFDSSNSLTQAKYCFADGGEYTYVENCEFYKSTHLGVTDACELLCNGDSSQYVNCTFGDLVNTVTDNFIRGCVSFKREVLSGKVARDVEFIHCLFLRKAGGTEASMAYIPGATDIERRLIYENCGFINAKLAAADPADALNIAAAQTEGEIYCIDCWTAGCTALAETGLGVFNTRPAGAAAGAEIVAAAAS